MTTGRSGFLLLRRDGGLWGVASAAVESLGRRNGSFRIGLAPSADPRDPMRSALAADEIVGVVDGLLIKPMAPVLRNFWREPSAGVAVHGELPVVVVDPGHVPSALRFEEGDPEDVEVLA